MWIFQDFQRKYSRTTLEVYYINSFNDISCEEEGAIISSDILKK